MELKGYERGMQTTYFPYLFYLVLIILIFHNFHKIGRKIAFIQHISRVGKIDEWWNGNTNNWLVSGVCVGVFSAQFGRMWN